MSAGRPRGWCRSPRLCRPAPGAGPPCGQRFVFRPGPADRGYKNFVTSFALGLAATRPRRRCPCAGPVHLHLRSPGRGHPGSGAASHHRDRRGRVAGPLRPPRRGHQLLQGRLAGPLRARSACGERRRPDPAAGQRGSATQTVAFAAELIDRSGKAPVIEAALAHRTGRPRPLPVRAVLTALLSLALDDRPLFLTEVTRLLFCQITRPPAGCSASPVPSPPSGRSWPPTAGSATASRAICSVMDPSALPKNRRLTEQDLKARTRPMTPAQAEAARGRLEAFINALLEASVSRPDRRRTRGLRRLHRAGRHPGPAVLPRPVQAHRPVRQRPRRRLVRPRRRPPRA